MVALYATCSFVFGMSKTYSALERLFPLTGKPGLMLAQYVRFGAHGIDIAGAGRIAGLSYATANRATAVLVESGLVVACDGGGYRFNIDAPHGGIVLDAVQAATGYEYRQEPRSWMDTPGWDGGVASLEVRDTVLARRMPEPLLKRGNAASGCSVVTPGPTALEARTFSLEIQHTVGASLMLLVDTLQEPYALWHEERDRDLIHQTMHLGAGVHAAISSLTTHADESDADAENHAVRWVHAAYALAAEAAYIQELLTELAHGADLIALRTKIDAQIHEARRDLKRVEADEALAARGRDAFLASYRDRLTRAEARREVVAEVIRNAHGRRALGFSGARLLYGTLEQYHHVIAPLAHEAFDHPSVQPWIAAYRDAAARGEQEPVDFDNFPIPSPERLPRHIRLKIEDIDAALEGRPGPLLAPFLTPTAR